MPHVQLPMFKRKTFPSAAQQQIIDPVAPTGESSVMKTLPAFLAYLRSSGYSESTTEKYFADVKKFSMFIREKKIGEVTSHDVEQWISVMVSPKGEALDRKTVNRKVSAIINYFSWLVGVEDMLFPYTDRFIQLLFADLKKQIGIDKELTPKTLRHTHVVRAYKRGEDTDRIFERIGLAPDSRKEADEIYSRLSRKGI